MCTVIECITAMASAITIIITDDTPYIGYHQAVGRVRRLLMSEELALVSTPVVAIYRAALRSGARRLTSAQTRPSPTSSE